MRLIGMLDSPYVRRVAVSLNLIGLPYGHEPLSVFRTFDQFAAINPVVKAPTFVTDDGVVLMDSGLILEHVERLAPAGQTLTPPGLADHARSQRVIGLALAACEKAVQLVYEFNLRPAERRHEPWIERVQGQLSAALERLDTEIAGCSGWLFGDRPLQADVTAAVAWTFTISMLSDRVSARAFPALAAFTQRAERRPEFRASPHA